jgi:pimeloyl-ACP methyl ester carboxylesterase
MTSPARTPTQPAGRGLAASFLLACAIACLAAACSEQRGADPVAQLDECRVHGFESAVRCGSLQVAEDPSRPEGRKIDIGFVVAPALARNKLTDAVFVLAGGPGQAATDVAPIVMPWFNRLNKRRDIVFIDQRGTGRSHALTCKSPDDLPMAEQLDPDAQIQRMRSCWKALDADTRMYTTEVAMRDIDAVRTRLGFEQVNLWGGSYGTRAALEYMRQFGSHVRTAILDGVAPAAMILPATMAVDSDQALRSAQAACAADAECAQAYPKFTGQLDTWLADLKSAPLKMQAGDPISGAREPVKLTRDGVLGMIRAPLYAAQVATLLPQVLQSAQSGNADPLLVLGNSLGDVTNDKFSFGMHLSVLCAEDVPLLDTAAASASVEAAGTSLFGSMYIDAYRGMCADWPVGKPSPAFFEPIKSDIPVLLLSGGLDPVTPPRHAEAVLAGLAHGKHLVADNIGHGVSGAGCGPDLVDKFIRAGNADGIDGACLKLIPRAPFLLPIRPGKQALSAHSKDTP